MRTTPRSADTPKAGSAECLCLVFDAAQQLFSFLSQVRAFRQSVAWAGG
jgi:hypothetical protein